MDKLTKGSIVLSAAGHDKGFCFAVINMIDENTALIADGRRRKLISPKKKNTKHLLLLGKIPADVSSLSNKALYAAIRDACRSVATDNAKQ